MSSVPRPGLKGASVIGGVIFRPITRDVALTPVMQLVTLKADAWTPLVVRGEAHLRH